MAKQTATPAPEDLTQFVTALDVPMKTLKSLMQVTHLRHLFAIIDNESVTELEHVGPATLEKLKAAKAQWLEYNPPNKQEPKERGVIDLDRLADPFEPIDIEWKPVATKHGKALAAAYITNRAVMDRLDSVVGPGRWQNSFEIGPGGGVLCGIGIEVTPGNWVWKWDGSENTDVQAVKGGLSTSMRRAGVQWGIGRYLYHLPGQWVRVDQYGRIDDPPTLPDWALPKTFDGDQVFAETEPEYIGGDGATSDMPQAEIAKAATPPDTPAQQMRTGDFNPSGQYWGPHQKHERDMRGEQLPMGKISEMLKAEYTEENDWGDKLPEKEKRKGFAKVNKADYKKITDHYKAYGWSGLDFVELIKDLFGVTKVSALNLYQYSLAWVIVKSEQAYQEYHGFALAREQERQDAKA